MIRLALLLLVVCAAAGCSARGEFRPANHAVRPLDRIHLPVVLCSRACLRERFPTFPTAGAVTVGGIEVWVATPLWNDPDAAELARLLCHETLAHVAVAWTDPIDALRAMDPGNGNWLRHAPEILGAEGRRP
jgi:hypothetical protein